MIKLIATDMDGTLLDSQGSMDDEIYDIIEKLKEDKTIWENYLHFSDAYKRIRIAYIEAARKRPEEFEKRLNNFINKTKENKIITGFGGIGKYY